MADQIPSSSRPASSQRSLTDAEGREIHKAALIDYEARRYHSLVSSINDLESSMLPNRKTVPVGTVKRQLQVIRNLTWNSSEFILPTTVPTIRVGIIGSPDSDRDKLVRKFFGPYVVQLYSGVGLRTKYLMPIHSRNHLILFREEVSAPAHDFATWVDVLIIVANSEEATVTAESYLEVFSKFRNPREVYIVLGSIKNDPKQSMAFQPRLESLVAGSSHHVIDIVSKRSVHDFFTSTCEGFVTAKIKSNRTNPGSVCMTPRTPATQAYISTPTVSVRETRSVARSRTMCDKPPKDVAVKDPQPGPSSTRLVQSQSKPNVDGCASRKKELRVRFASLTEPTLENEKATQASLKIPEMKDPGVTEPETDVYPCDLFHPKPQTTPKSDREVLKPHSGTRGREPSIPYFRMGVKRKFPDAAVEPASNSDPVKAKKPTPKPKVTFTGVNTPPSVITLNSDGEDSG